MRISITITIGALTQRKSWGSRLELPGALSQHDSTLAIKPISYVLDSHKLHGPSDSLEVLKPSTAIHGVARATELASNAVLDCVARVRDLLQSAYRSRQTPICPAAYSSAGNTLTVTVWAAPSAHK